MGIAPCGFRSSLWPVFSPLAPAKVKVNAAHNRFLQTSHFAQTNSHEYDLNKGLMIGSFSFSRDNNNNNNNNDTYAAP